MSTPWLPYDQCMSEQYLISHCGTQSLVLIFHAQKYLDVLDELQEFRIERICAGKQEVKLYRHNISALFTFVEKAGACT